MCSFIRPDPMSSPTEKHERKAHVSVIHGNAPCYEAWRLKLAAVLDRRGSIADAARAYALVHGREGQERTIQIAIAKIKSGCVMAGGEWVCFFNEWMARNPQPIQTTASSQTASESAPCR